jgi:hypothetical protein
VVASYAESAPKLAAWMEKNIPQGLAIFALPPAQQRRRRTTNALERVNRELKRRTRVAGLFPNEASLLRLVSALLAEHSDEWVTGKTYPQHATPNLALCLTARQFTEKKLRRQSWRLASSGFVIRRRRGKCHWHFRFATEAYSTLSFQHVERPQRLLSAS